MKKAREKTPRKQKIVDILPLLALCAEIFTRILIYGCDLTLLRDKSDLLVFQCSL